MTWTPLLHQYIMTRVSNHLNSAAKFRPEHSVKGKSIEHLDVKTKNEVVINGNHVYYIKT